MQQAKLGLLVFFTCAQSLLQLQDHESRNRPNHLQQLLYQELLLEIAYCEGVKIIVPS
jgi:hypothetical protein